MVKKGENKNIAIVLGPKCVNATGLIRSLGEKGFFVIFASTYSKIESKYLSGYFRLPDSFDEQFNALTDFILTLPKKPFIYTVDDRYNFLLDENYKSLSEIAYIPHASGELKRISDKSVMTDLALKSGLIVPKSIKLDLFGDINHGIDYPIILKPYAGYAGSKGDITICKDEDAFIKAVNELKNDGYKQVLLQELVDGKDKFEIGLMGISLPSGEVIIPATIKKIRSYPMDRGSTSYAKIESGVNYVDSKKLEDFVRSTGYIGLFDIEMIISNGKAYFIEINYRNGQYGYSITKAGYNLPYYWAQGLIGETLPKDLAITEIYYINERDDKLHVKDGLISKKQWKKEFKGASAFGMYCKGDNRPYIRQYVKIPDRVKIACKKIKNRIKDLLVKEEWCVAVRKMGEKPLFENKDFTGFRVLKNTFRYWCADPFIIEKNGTVYVLFEAYDRFKAKGFIGYREIFASGKVGKIKKAIETPYHMSFPYLYSLGEDIFMMPESYASKKLTIYKAVDFPSKWQEEKVILNERVCDSVLLDAQNKSLLLTSKIFTADSELYAYKKTSDGYKLVSDEPIVVGKDIARNGGKVISYNDKLLRVSQDCKKGYGLAVNFSELSFENDKYLENLVAKVSVKDFSKEIKKYVGIHTYNSTSNYEVIDLKYKNKFKFGNLINLFYRIFK